MPDRVFFIYTFLPCCLLTILKITKQVCCADDTSGWKAGDFPDPVLDPQTCGLLTKDISREDTLSNRNNTLDNNLYFARICDPDRILLQPEIILLEDLIRRCHSKAPCECGANCTESSGFNIAVAIVDQLNTEGDFQPMIIKAKLFSEEVRLKWFENEGCDDNVLLFYTWHTNKLYISLGSLAEKVISDIELARLYETGKRLFVRKPKPEYGVERDPRMESNITSTYLGMDALIRQTHTSIMNGSSVTSRVVFSIAIPILLVLSIILMCLISNCCCAQDFLYDPTADKHTMDRLIRDFQPMIIKAKLFSEEVRLKWFENESCDDNVLLFYTWHTNKLYISLGSLAEKVISDIELARLYETGKRLFVRKPKPEYGVERDPRMESNITSTYLGMDALIRQTHTSIMNGSSVTSRVVFSIAIPILLVLSIILMCLISNCCCAQDFLYDPTADKHTMDRLIRDFQPMIIKSKLFSEEVRLKWFENEGCDDNVLLFYTWHTNKLYISLGSLAEKVISDIELARLYETGKRLFVRKPKPEYGVERDPRMESNITSTYLGMDALIRQTHTSIMNGSSVTSRVVFSIAIPILLVLSIILMCLISNCCCAQDFLYDPTADKHTMDRLIR